MSAARARTEKPPRLRIGVSSCLLGQKVRYNGGHKRDNWIARTLARHFELVPICPEVAIGLGVPRAPIQLVRRGTIIRAIGVEDDAPDVTRALMRYGREMASTLDDLCGYIFKSRSPSCGIAGVAVQGARGKTHAGLYAHAFVRARPRLPVEDEDRLRDPAVRAQFLARVRAYASRRATRQQARAPGPASSPRRPPTRRSRESVRR